MDDKRTLSRRDFVRLSALTIGGLIIGGCRREEIAPVPAPPVSGTNPPPAVYTAITPSNF